MDAHEKDLNIQWYPGHMTKTRRMIAEQLRHMDAVCEILDARAPQSCIFTNGGTKFTNISDSHRFKQKA